MKEKLNTYMSTSYYPKLSCRASNGDTNNIDLANLTRCRPTDRHRRFPIAAPRPVEAIVVRHCIGSTVSELVIR